MKDKSMSQLHPVSALMDEKQFWSLIEQSHTIAQAASDDEDEQQTAQCESLAGLLKQLDWQDIAAFDNRFSTLVIQSYDEKLWCAAYVLCGGCGDDGFDYFRYWLISRGEAVYRGVLADPDSLIDHVSGDVDDGCYEFEDFAYVAMGIFEEKTGEELDKYTDIDHSIPDIEFSWDEDDPESIKAICPKLYAAFWE
mgnify:FL=1